MIRLVSGDRARWVDDPCPCGRTYPRLPDGLYGRFDDLIIVRGENIYPSAIEDPLRAIDGFGGEFRVIVSRRETMDELLVRAEYTTGHGAQVETLRALMRERLRARLGVHPIVDGNRGRSGIQILPSSAVGEYCAGFGTVSVGATYAGVAHQSGVAGYGGIAGELAVVPLRSTGTVAPSCIAAAPVGTPKPSASSGPTSAISVQDVWTEMPLIDGLGDGVRLPPPSQVRNTFLGSDSATRRPALAASDCPVRSLTTRLARNTVIV
jgi:hypothetical protein